LFGAALVIARFTANPRPQYDRLSFHAKHEAYVATNAEVVLDDKRSPTTRRIARHQFIEYRYRFGITEFDVRRVHAKRIVRPRSPWMVRFNDGQYDDIVIAAHRIHIRFGRGRVCSRLALLRSLPSILLRRQIRFARLDDIDWQWYVRKT
jgi:hypothetical protein